MDTWISRPFIFLLGFYDYLCASGLDGAGCICKDSVKIKSIICTKFEELLIFLGLPCHGRFGIATDRNVHHCGSDRYSWYNRMKRNKQKKTVNKRTKYQNPSFFRKYPKNTYLSPRTTANARTNLLDSFFGLPKGT